MHWCCPKSVAYPGGPFDPCEAEWSVLIGRHFAPWIEGCVFPLILLKSLHNYIFQGTYGTDIILDKYACKKC
jgi:hypothetical protein